MKSILCLSITSVLLNTKPLNLKMVKDLLVGAEGSRAYISGYIYEGFPSSGVPFGGPRKKDYSVFGVYIGVPLFAMWSPGQISGCLGSGFGVVLAHDFLCPFFR